MVQLGHWIIAGVAGSLFVSSVLLLIDSYGQTTSMGLPQWLYVYPVAAGSLFMALFGVANAVHSPPRLAWGTLGAAPPSCWRSSSAGTR
jgi:TRAP-type C4-dicarboxylate transport system permease small subunit